MLEWKNRPTLSKTIVITTNEKHFCKASVHLDLDTGSEQDGESV